MAKSLISYKGEPIFSDAYENIRFSKLEFIEPQVAGIIDLWRIVESSGDYKRVSFISPFVKVQEGLDNSSELNQKCLESQLQWY